MRVVPHILASSNTHRFDWVASSWTYCFGQMGVLGTSEVCKSCAFSWNCEGKFMLLLFTHVELVMVAPVDYCIIGFLIFV
jgi:hypothetical protein